ncbi:lantibiotic dehydratase [Pseudorhodoferax sp.]|uniref:lantibiotic dehydratase n=1 Tax=Pseudorhodoferax sp. TaxID=1993553 RepID=UPI002DD69C23|nr:lantibiotic dehydratase [Pseudorhodoferax sp.]
MNITHMLQGRDGALLLHPRYVLRVAGESVHALQGIETGETARALAEGERLEAELRGGAPALCAALEGAVHGCTDRDLSRAALNVKRAVFNRRPMPPGQVDALAGLVDEATLAGLRRFERLARELAGHGERVRQAYASEIEATFARMAALWQLPRLRDAISYANPELFADFEALTRGDGKSISPKVRRKLQDTFVQYLSRCSAKTSPLSTFTVLHVGRWDGSAAAGGWDLDYAPGLDRRLALNGAVMRQILAPLLGSYALSSSLFALALNPSLVFEGGRARFRTVTEGNTSSGKFYGTGEAVAEINGNAAIACLHQVFARRDFEPIREPDLVAAMCTLAPKLQPAVVRELLRKLYDLRLLLPDTQPWEQADPLAWTEQLLGELPGDAGLQARTHLRAVRQALDDFRAAAPPRRAELVGTVRTEVQGLRAALHAPEHETIGATTFFENCYLQAPDGSLGTQVLQPFADDLGLLMALSPVVGFTQQARCDMADFFLAEFGADGVCEQPLDFIRRFDQVYALGSLTHAPDPQRRAPPTAVSEAFASARRQFNELITSRLTQAGDVQLDRDALHAVVEALPEPVRQRGGSQCYVAQVARRDGRTLLVLNQVFGGRGALMSRFMEVLQPAELQEVRDYLLNSSEGALFAELPGVFGFNANHHPRMADHELVVPPFAANWEDTRKFEIDKLRLVYDAREHMVRFKTEDGRDIDVWYQGFLMPMLLPRIQRVLAIAYTEGINNFTINPMMKMGLVQSGEVTCVPRVSLGDVVLARRTWIIPAARQPDAGLSAEDFFVAVQAWRHALGLPAQVFLRGMPLPEPGADAGAGLNQRWNAVDFKDLKPFHVRFDSPRLVRLMQRTLKRNSFALVATEVLPALDDQHVSVQGQPHVAELQFELSTVPPRLLAAPRDAQWHALRIAYFDDDRRALLLGPVSGLIDELRRDHALDRVMLIPHWRHGPHIDLVVHCSESVLQQAVWPAVRRTLVPWLQANPSTRVIDPAAYEALSQRLALFELDPGPVLPLLQDNSVSEAAYSRPAALKLDDFGRAREDFQVAALPLVLELLRSRGGSGSGDDFLLTLVAMQAMTGGSYEDGGLSRGYVSFRSHADYFFAAHDEGKVLRRRFDALDQRLAGRVDAVLRAVLSDGIDALPLPPACRQVLARWQQILPPMVAQNRRIVARHYDVLLADETFERLQGSVTRQGQDGFQARMRERVPSEIGQALAQPHGRRAMSTPQVMAYRTSVNFFYTLLPLLGVSPAQKFCLCHLVALGVERVLGVSWRDITGLRAGQPRQEVQA